MLAKKISESLEIDHVAADDCLIANANAEPNSKASNRKRLKTSGATVLELQAANPIRLVAHAAQPTRATRNSHRCGTAKMIIGHIK